MKLTRKHLNQILLSLPNPRLVEQGSTPPYIEIPVYKHDEMCTDIFNAEVEINKISFEYDANEMDWVLKDLTL